MYCVMCLCTLRYFVTVVTWFRFGSLIPTKLLVGKTGFCISPLIRWADYLRNEMIWVLSGISNPTVSHWFNERWLWWLDDVCFFVWLWTQENAETKLEPDAYVVLQIGNTQHQTTVKEAATNPTWEEQFEFLCDDPLLQELSVMVCRVTYLLTYYSLFQ